MEVYANGYKWIQFKENGLPETHTEPVEYIKDAQKLTLIAIHK